MIYILENIKLDNDAQVQVLMEYMSDSQIAQWIVKPLWNYIQYNLLHKNPLYNLQIN